MKLLLSLVLLLMCALPLIAQMPMIEPGVPHDLAIWRAAHYSDVRYKLNLTLEKMSPVLKGTIEIRVNVSEPPASAGGQSANQTALPIILDWRKIAGHEKDSTISNVSLNGRAVSISTNWPPADAGGSDFAEHLIFRDGVQPGENVIKLDFTSPILTSGSAITRYIDKEDGSEYLYSLFVPSDASTAFPVFDQPDLKARFTVNLNYPENWKVVSNSPIREGGSTIVEPDFSHPEMSVTTNWVHLAETKPISTYVFAFAAGPWQEFSTPGITGGNLSGSEGVTNPAQKNTLPTGQVSASATEALNTHIYVRRSQAAKFQPHAAEVFRLTRDGVKFLEDYFDYKFPWPKYDLVLIPEFPFGGMEHAGATFLSERGVIFPSEPTANDYISRANLIFHETAHQWFGDTVTMKWFDDLWLKEGFAEFMAYKTLETVMPQYNAWKAFYERNKQAAYLTDSTKGTTAIYQPIENLSAAKSAYGNIVYRKAPSFLRQAEFYLGPEKFQTAVRAFLKKHAFANATWQDLVSEFEAASGHDLNEWANRWVLQKGVPIIHSSRTEKASGYCLYQSDALRESSSWEIKIKVFMKNIFGDKGNWIRDEVILPGRFPSMPNKNPVDKILQPKPDPLCWEVNDAFEPKFVFSNYQDYGYGIFLLDDKSGDYVLKNIQNEKDDFLRSMMWGSLWDSVREAELDPREYVELAIKNLPIEKDETITASVLGRVSTAMTYYLANGAMSGSEPPAVAGGSASKQTNNDLNTRLETLLVDKMKTAPTLGQKITFYRAFLNIASTPSAQTILKQMLAAKNPPAGSQRSDAIPLKTKDRFDIVTRLAILGDPDATKLLADLEKTETSDDAKRYAYAAHAAFATKENREKFWNDFVNNKDISESWIEAAMGPFNSPKHSDLSLPYLQRALAELPNLKRNRKIFFVNGWLGAFIGGQKSQEALDIVNKFLADNPTLDNDLSLKILENVDIIERAVKIRNKYGQNHLR